jgi:hypothetical protein
MDISRDDENRALAFAALNLAQSTINVLERKGVLDDAEVQSIIDGALTSLEFRPQDKSIDLARRIVEGFAVSRKAAGSEE